MVKCSPRTPEFSRSNQANYQKELCNAGGSNFFKIEGDEKKGRFFNEDNRPLQSMHQEALISIFNHFQNVRRCVMQEPEC